MFCIGLRKLNNCTIKDNYFLPCIDETLHSLQGSQWLSLLDLKSWYWQVKMDEESKPLTSFTVGPLRFYECDRIPFRLTNAPATFQQLMGTCLRDLSLNWCIIYLNDIVIFLKDPASHLMRLEAEFQKLEQARLKLKPSKYKFFCRQITYLEHIGSTQGVVTDEEKISIIRKWPAPTTVTEVQSFLRYYHWFIPQLAQIAKPLHVLTSGKNAGKKRAAVTWDDICQQSFDELKCLCTTAPILAYVDFTRSFKLPTNMCGSGLGGVLYQTCDDWTSPMLAGD